MDEHGEQVEVIRWAIRTRLGSGRVKDYLISIPNGGLRNMKVAMKLKAEGVTKGVSDLFLALPNGKYAGLWIEMKTMKGRASKEQLEWIERMKEVGYEAVVCKGHEEAIQVLEEYLGQRLSEPPVSGTSEGELG